MLNNSWYSVISPENCSTILWRSWDFKEKAAEALKLTANDMKKNGLVDKIIKEPLSGAHSEPEMTFKIVKKEINNSIKHLQSLSIKDLIKERMDKFCTYFFWNSFNNSPISFFNGSICKCLTDSC